MLTVVTGPPCSGKTTYVSEHRQPGDVIIDFDALAQAFGADSREYTPAITAVTQYARGAAIKIAITWHLRGARVWITDCQPSAARRQQYARAGAVHVALAVDPAELHRRIEAERPASYHALADAMLGLRVQAARAW
jgi:predicted ABC-type ATPase